MESPMTKTMQDVEATTLKVWLEQGEALLIDVREPPEHAAEHIPDARLLPLSTFDPVRVPQEAGRKWSCTALWVCAQRKRGRSCSTPVL
jgi:rhodanese-related sulfurtransferase